MYKVITEVITEQGNYRTMIGTMITYIIYIYIYIIQ